MLRRHSLSWLALLVALTLALAACGGDEGAEDTSDGDDDSAEADQDQADDGGDDAASDDGGDDSAGDDTAGDWEPSEDVTVTVPFNPGGGADTSQRTWNEYAEPLIPVSLNVENREGAGGVTGWTQMINEGSTDGHHIAIATPPFNVLPKVMDPEAVPYEHEDFTYICIYGVVPGVLYVPEDSEWESLDDFIAAAEDDPGNVSVAVAGQAGAEALLTYMLMNETGIELTMVPFDGGSESVTAVRSGTTDAMFGSTNWIEEQEGELRPLAIARASDEDPEYPDVPSFNELGYDIVQERYRALAGPPEIDEAAVQYWADICQQVVENEDFRQAMRDTGNPPPGSFIGPEESTERVMNMVSDIETVVEEFDIQGD